MGKADWRIATPQSAPQILPVTVNQYPAIKKKLVIESQKISERKIHPTTILIHRGETKPIVEHLTIRSKKITIPKVFPAPPLMTRDNAKFNISYINKQRGYIGAGANDFAEDNAHNIWIASGNTLIKYDGFHYYLYDKKTGLPDLEELTLLYDNKQRLWLASNKGVYYLKNDSIYYLTSKEINFSTIACTKVQQDSNDRIWISTKQNGAICMDDKTIKIYDVNCGLRSNHIYSTLVDKKGNIFLGADTGVYEIAPNKLRLFFSKNKFRTNSFPSLYEDADGIWVGGFLSGFF